MAQKSVFEISDKLILVKLHEAAIKKADSSKVVGIVNTGLDNFNNPNPDKCFLAKDGIYEIGVSVIIETDEEKDAEKKPVTADKKDLEKSKKAAEDAVKKAKKLAYETISDYVKWFAGPDAEKKVQQDSLIPFNPDMSKKDDATIQIKNNKISSLDEKAVEKAKQDKKAKMLAGFKIAYELQFKE